MEKSNGLRTFINPFSETGFKILFGQTKNKDLLIDLLNTLLGEESNIEDIQYLDNELTSSVEPRETKIYDICCLTSKKEYILLGMQYKKRKSFFTQTLLYAAEILDGQTEKYEDLYDISAMYEVYLMNFEDDECNEFLNEFTFMNEKTHYMLSDKFRMLYYSIPLFKKKEEECENRLDKWIYILKNMENLSTIPWVKDDPIFYKLAQEGAIAKLSEAQYEKYCREIDQIKFTKES